MDALHTIPRDLACQLNPLISSDLTETIYFCADAAEELADRVHEDVPVKTLACVLLGALRYECSVDRARRNAEVAR